MYSFSYLYKKRFTKKEVINVLLLKVKLSLDVFFQYATLFLEIQMGVGVLYPSSKQNNTLHNLLINLS